MINQGNSPILANYYDLSDPVGFEVTDGVIADEPTLLDASNNYLREKLITNKNDEKSVIFSNVILEPNEYFEIKVLVLYDIGKIPYIKAFGKIAFVKSIDVATDYLSASKSSFIELIIGGGLWVNFARLTLFGLLFFFIVLIMVWVLDIFSKRRNLKKKEGLVNLFKSYNSDKITEKDNFFFDYYLNEGGCKILELYLMLNFSSEILIFLKKGPKDVPNLEDTENKDTWLVSNLSSATRSHFRELVNEGFVVVENHKPKVDEQRFIVLENFVNYLRRKGELKGCSYVENFYNRISEPKISGNNTLPVEPN